eukprot:879276-Prymnesium_polylepis.1
MATLVLLSDRDLFRLRATVLRPCTVHFCLAWAVSVVRNELGHLNATHLDKHSGGGRLKPALIGRPAIGLDWEAAGLWKGAWALILCLGAWTVISHQAAKSSFYFVS